MLARGLEFEVGDRVRVEKVVWAYEKHLIGREGVVTKVLPGLLQNGFEVRVGGAANVYAPHRISLVRKARDGEHVELESGATMIAGAAPKAGERPTHLPSEARIESCNAPWRANTARDRVCAAVHAERERQTEKWGDQWGAGNTPPETKFLILTEEFGEIAKEVLESGGKETPHLATELVQLAAVAVAWLESIDGEAKDG